MAKNRKTVFKLVDYLHCDDFARYLEHMAANGWHFKEWGAGLKFEKGEPEHATYAVEVFTGASENDTRPEPETEAFAEYCEAAGWKLIDAKQKFCIFKKADENAVPIMTEEERLDSIYKAGRFTNLLLLFLYGLNAVLQWMQMFGSSMSYRIFSSLAWFGLSIWSALFLLELGKLITRIVWKHKMKKRIRQGLPIYAGNRKSFVWSNLFRWLLALGTLLWLCLLGQKESLFLSLSVIAVLLLFSYLIARFRPDNTVNSMLQVLVGFGIFVATIVATFVLLSDSKEPELTVKDVPLLMEDYREFSQEISYIDGYQTQNLFGSFETHILFYETESLSYTIYRTDSDRLLNRLWEQTADRKRNYAALDCTEQWDATLALKTGTGEYFIQYEDSILIFRDYELTELTQEQIDCIREKLNVK